MAEGLFILRALVGALLFAHGTQKLFGWFGGHGLDGTGGFFEQIGHRPGRLMAMAAGLSEAGGGALLFLGLFTPLGAAMVIGVMTVASISVHADNGLWATDGGYELPLTYAVIAGALAFTGAGSFSLDDALDLPLSGWGWGLGAVVVGLAGAAVQLSRRTKVAQTEDGTASDDDAYPADHDLAGDPASADANQRS
jgi:putative oxidoreductase